MNSSPPPVLPLPSPIDVEGALAEALAKLEGVDDLALIGGVALALHGWPGFTKDVDLAATVGAAAEAERRYAGEGVLPLRIGGISVATRVGVRVDLIDRRFEYRGLFEEAIASARAEGPRTRAGGREVAVVPKRYLAALKLLADRPQDEVDLGVLLADPTLDYPAARAIVERHLGAYAARRFDRLARAARRPDAPEDYGK
jgi:hypothetical protein